MTQDVNAREGEREREREIHVDILNPRVPAQRVLSCFYATRPAGFCSCSCSVLGPHPHLVGSAHDRPEKVKGIGTRIVFSHPDGSILSNGLPIVVDY